MNLTQHQQQEENKESRIIETQGKINTPSKLKTTIDTTARHSVESSFSQMIFKNLFKNMKQAFVNVYDRLNEDDDCMGCRIGSTRYPEVNFKVNVMNYILLKHSAKGNKEKDNLSFNDCKILINFN